MKIISDKHLDFLDFYKLLTESIDEDGVLRDVVVEGCTIYNIPKSVRIIELRFKFKMFGISLYETNDRFCGFRCEGCLIERNVFKFKKI